MIRPIIQLLNRVKRETFSRHQQLEAWLVFSLIISVLQSFNCHSQEVNAGAAYPEPETQSTDNRQDEVEIQEVASISSVKQLFELDLAQLRSKMPVTLEGVITMLDSTLWVSFIQEEGGDGVYVYFIDTNEFKEGMKVRVEGKTDLGYYSPFVVSEKVTLLDENPAPPEPRIARISEINQGLHDSRLVRITARVRKIQSYLGWSIIEVDENGNRIQIVTKAGLIRGELKVGAIIQADGIIGLTLNLNEELGERTGFQLLSQSGFGGIEVLQPGPDDLFDAPLFQIDQLRFYNLQITHGEPIQIEAVVSWKHRNQTLWLTDGKFGLPVFLAEPTKMFLNSGDRVQVAGFGHDIHGRVHIEDAVLRKVDSPTEEEIYYNRVQLPIEKPGQLHGTPAEITGTLLSRTFWSESDLLLTLQKDAVRFWVWMQRDDSMLPEVWYEKSDWALGSQLRVRGILLTRKVHVEPDYEWPSQFTNSKAEFNLNMLVQSPEMIEVAGVSQELVGKNDQTQTTESLTETGISSDPSILLTPSTIGAISAGSALLAGIALFFICRYQNRLKQEIQNRDSEKLDIETRDTLINLAGDWLLTLTEDGKILRMNEAASSALNFKNSEEDGKSSHYFENYLSKDSVAAFRGVFFEAKRPTAQPSPTSFVELQCLPGGKFKDASIQVEMAFIPVYSESSLKYFIAYGKNTTLVNDLTSSLRKTELSLRASYESQERLARDLHDGIVQSVFAIGLSLETCRVQLQRGGVATGRIEESLKSISEDINRVIREIRGFISEIESGPLSGSELKPAIKSLILTLESFDQLHFYLDIEPDASRSLTSREVTQLIFIIREAISNAIRHASAENVTISLRRVKSSILLEIKDNGIGFDAEGSANESGHGLRNMRSRARELNADFEIHSQAGIGSNILVRLRKSSLDKLS